MHLNVVFSSMVLLHLFSQLCRAETPLIVAHRGASAHAPENTIPAFTRAWEQGADAIELDIHLTKDGVIVCFHDPDTEKITGIKKIIRECTYQELQVLDVGRHKGAEFVGVRIPTLSEALNTVPPNGRVFIEIKTDSTILPTLFQVLDTSKVRSDQVVFISFNDEVLTRIRHTSPDHKVVWLTKYREDAFGRARPTRTTILKTLTRIRADGISIQKTIRDRRLINTLQKRGFEFHVWTVQDPDLATWFQRSGVTSITTKDPEALLLRQHDEPNTSTP